MTPDVEAIVKRLTVDTLRAPGLRGSAEDRFWKYVDRKGGDECWLWTGRVSSRGYGRLQTPFSASTPAHRVSFVLHHGEILRGNVVDHICRNRLCVNPKHLRQTDPVTNTLENSAALTALNKAKSHCVRGHPLTGSNAFIRENGWRQCRACQTIHRKKYLNRTAHILSQEQNP